jgi:ATP-dependent Clp protease ATP-binding subunit ClpC
MLLDDKGLNLAAFDPVLASTLGADKGEAGCNVLAMALVHRHAQIQLRDWLYCLAKAPGTELRRRLIDAPGKIPDRFIEAVEDAVIDDLEPSGIAPLRLTAAAVAPEVLKMLSAAERIAQENQRRNICDVVLTLALIEVADQALRNALAIWITEDGLKAFVNYLRSKIEPRDMVGPFTKEGKLDLALFDPSGRKFLKRAREDAASVGAKKVTTRHLLYTLLGNESGLLPVALSVRGVDVKRELQSVLSRELARAGAKRNEGLELTRDTLFEAVVQFLGECRKSARERGARTISEFDIGKTVVFKQAQELARLFPSTRPLDQAGLRAYVESAKPDQEEEEVKPVQRFTIAQIEANIRERIIGQDTAVARVIPWIKRLRFGLPRVGRPAAVFLFLGPTGAGKTQLAKELARYVFGDEDMMVFLEMGQFKSKESMNMFIGAPPGYVGYGDGKLTNGLKEKPESVVLFDEIEKADTQVFDTLLRFADEGMISDPAGPVRDGRKCIIVMTTNAGQAWLRDHLKNDPEARADVAGLSTRLFDEAMKEMQAKGFRPEFLGRLDERITFLPFSIESCRKILDGVLDRELESIRKLKDITIEVPADVRDVLAQKVFDRSIDEGARGAPRAVNEFIITPVIDRMADSDTGEGAPAAIRMIASRVGMTNIALEVVS